MTSRLALDRPFALPGKHGQIIPRRPLLPMILPGLFRIRKRITWQIHNLRIIRRRRRIIHHKRRRPAAIQTDRIARPKPNHRIRHLTKLHPQAASLLAPVNGKQQQLPIGFNADPCPRMNGRIFAGHVFSILHQPFLPLSAIVQRHRRLMFEPDIHLRPLHLRSSRLRALSLWKRVG